MPNSRSDTRRARVRGRDVFFRGRGADVGVRASAFVVRLVGAVIAFAIITIAEALGFIQILGISASLVKLIAVIVGALVAPTAIGWLLWPVAATLVVLQLVVSWTPVVRPLVPRFVRSDAPRVDAQAMIVLSGGMNDDGRLHKQALSRLLTGIRLMRERRIPTLLLSVSAEQLGNGFVTTEADQRALVALGVPAGVDLHFVHDVHSTRDEALSFAALARTHGWQRVIVVTSPLHSARACATIEQTGLTVECRPAELREYSIDRLDRAENRRLAFIDVVYESAAWVLYRMRGWV